MPLTFSITVGIGAAFITLRRSSRSSAARSPRSTRCSGRSPSPSSSTSGRPGSTRSCRSSRRTVATRRHPTAPGPSGRGAASDSCTIGRMFERTALPAGPRVISARLPAARSVSVAAYVLAGSRLETPRPDRRRPLHGAPHVQGHGGVPDDARDQRGDRGRRRLVQRGDRPRIDGLLGPRPAPRGRARDGRRRRADRPAHARRGATSRASGRSSSRRSARTSTTRPSTARSCSRPRCSATGRSGARSAARRPTSGRSPTAAIHDFWRDDVPAGQHGRGGRRRPRARRGDRARRRRVRDGQRRRPRVRAGARPARRPAGPHRQARHEPGAARASASRRSTATTPTAGRWPSSTRSSATG